MTETKTTDARLRDAVAEVAQGLIDRGIQEEAARELAGSAKGRILVSESGALRILQRGGGLYPADPGDPMGYLVRDLVAGAGADVKVNANLKDRDPEAAERNKASLRARSSY